jgi:hypothetical protein
LCGTDRPTAKPLYAPSKAISASTKDNLWLTFGLEPSALSVWL